MKIIFVGMHNKPWKKPLCESTRSGQVIDAIIKEFNAINCVKTNLYDTDKFPSALEDKIAYASDWIFRVNPSIGDIIVLLGAEVHNNFKKPNYEVHLVKLAHPASVFGRQKISSYVSNAVELINKKLKKQI